MEDQVWNSARGRGKQQVVPLMLPPHPAQYCFPEDSDMVTNLDDRPGNGLLVMKLKLKL